MVILMRINLNIQVYSFIDKSSFIREELRTLCFCKLPYHFICNNCCIPRELGYAMPVVNAIILVLLTYNI